MTKLINNNEDLQSFCDSLNGEPFITVDLEFVREKTYYANWAYCFWHFWHLM